MMTDDQLSALLRLKRHELPPPGYFDRLLQDVHRRQRQELLQRPLWRIALERWQTFFSEHSMGPLSYAGAMATVLLVGAASVSFFTSAGPAPQGGQPALAQVAAPVTTPVVQVAARARLPLETYPARDARLAASLPQPQFQPLPQPARGSEVRRYVIDARPVGYDLSSF